MKTPWLKGRSFFPGIIRIWLISVVRKNTSLRLPRLLVPQSHQNSHPPKNYRLTIILLAQEILSSRFDFAPFENLYHLRHASVWRNLHYSMHMIVLNAHLADPPSIHFARLIHKLLEADGNFALQHSFPIFRYPYQMILKTVLCM